MKVLVQQIQKQLEADSHAYDMGCLISSEFTPEPGHNEVKELVDDSNFTIKEVIDFCLSEAYKDVKKKSDRNELMYIQEPYGARIWTENDVDETEYFETYQVLRGIYKS